MAGISDGRYLDLQALKYLVRHIFLPPKVPSEDDFQPDHDRALLGFTISSLTGFKDAIAANRQDMVAAVHHSLSQLRTILGSNSTLSIEKVEEALENLKSQDATIPLYIKEQNSGILVSKADDSVIVEAFELSPLNSKVVGTKGRLRRSFPGPAVSLPAEKFSDLHLREAIAHTLVTMSHQHAPGTLPRTKKAKKMHDETRNTVHPRMVTQLFLQSFLLPIGKNVDIHRLWKHTREEVCYHDALLPWRRSPLWLFLRVVLQLHFSRAEAAYLYKAFMVFLMSRILRHASATNMPSDILQVMQAKISRRILKLEDALGSSDKADEFKSILESATQTTGNATRILQKRWRGIIEGTESPIDLSVLSSLDFNTDTMHTLPTLSVYLGSTNGRLEQNLGCDFHPEGGLLKYDAEGIPDVPSIEDDYGVYNLRAFETWVEKHLAHWLDSHLKATSTCGVLHELMRKYFNISSPFYSQDPEGSSAMILTILELWVALDKSATHLFGLLHEYDPDIPTELLEFFLLPFKRQMKRLHAIKTYLASRQSRASHGSDYVFARFGERNSFAVEYFSKSQELNSLLSEIEADAVDQELKKRLELWDRQREYQRLMSLYQNCDCEYSRSSVPPYWQHKWDCKKCSYESRANGLSISIHEWPLPSNRLEAQATVFELRVPVPFGHWRDATMFFRQNILGSKYGDNHVPSYQAHISCYDNLYSYLEKFDAEQRVELVSHTKSMNRSHYNGQDVATATRNDVCVSNGMHWQYFDNQKGCFVSELVITDKVPTMCTYTLRDESLQKYIFRSVFEPQNPTANTVIAKQSECPDHLSLEEYKALANLRLGTRLWWKNILTQLAVPSVDFKKVETTLFILQALYQGGPFGQTCEIGEAHEVVEDECFAEKLLLSLGEAATRVSENWESYPAFGTFIAIATRLLCLTSSPQIRHDCHQFLSRARKKTLSWATRLKSKVQELPTDEQRTEFVCKSVEIALVSMDTFYVPKADLVAILTSGPAEGACMFLQCSIIIQEGNYTIPNNSDPRVRHLHRRWQWLSYRAYPILAKWLVPNRSPLNDAIAASWSTYEPSTTGWHSESRKLDYWLVSKIRRSDLVHMNLLTGELLLNGSPLSRLPPKYENHETYHILFGPSALEVMRLGAESRYEFSGKKQFSGHKLQFALCGDGEDSGSDLIVEASKDGETWELIPQRLFRNLLPHAYVEKYVHWYNTANSSVEFRPIDAPWTSSPTNWTLVPMQGMSEWHLRRHDELLVSIQSTTAKRISQILSPLAHKLHIHVKFRRDASRVEIDLPISQLSFDLEMRSTSISSREFPGMLIDEKQALGTLVGVKHKLILKGTRDRKRLVILPDGPIRYHQTSHHVDISIDRDTAKTVHPFEIDEDLRILKDNQTLKSKLFICLLHALSSYCLPDHFTGRTGTEQALSILNSAAVRSFDYISPDDPVLKILSQIAALTPIRSYYPEYLREMQVVQWDQNLSFLAQHGDFYTAVKKILLQVDRSAIFHPEARSEAANLTGPEVDLLDRDNIRVSTFRVSGFGAESYTTHQDRPYLSRDQDRDSNRIARAYSMSKGILTEENIFHSEPPSDLDDKLWYFLSKRETISGTGTTPDLTKIRYSGVLLRECPLHIAEDWLGLQKTLGRKDPELNKYQLMMWLSTLAFSESADMAVLETIARFYILPEMLGIKPTVTGPFRPQSGLLSERDLRDVARGLCFSFDQSPDFSMYQYGHEGSHEFWVRRNNTFDSNKSAAVVSLAEAVTGQWPCAQPSQPQGGGNPNFNLYVDVPRFMADIKPMFRLWYGNWCLRRYLKRLRDTIQSREAITVQAPQFTPTMPEYVRENRHCYVSTEDIIKGPSPSEPSIRQPLDLQRILIAPEERDEAALRLEELVLRLERQAAGYEKEYAKDLRESLRSLQDSRETCTLSFKKSCCRREILALHRMECEGNVKKRYEKLTAAATSDKDGENAGVCTGTYSGPVARKSNQWPRISPVFFLQMLARDVWPALSESWKKAVVHYALSISEFQRAERLLNVHESAVDLIRELKNEGHRNWSPFEYPESLLLEVESGITIRDVQEDIAKDMREPRSQGNAVMQLNMGEGKSSVIVPIVSSALADGKRLVRVVVAKPQSRQMLQMLISKLGGMLNRRVYHMPFSRALRLTLHNANTIGDICHECMKNGGILLVQPEHILSFKLMGLECLINGKWGIGDSILRTQHLFDVSSRDIVDESDENFNVKFELIYTMGTQRRTEFCPGRWRCIQEILGLVRYFAPKVQNKLPLSIELSNNARGGFPRTRILRPDAQELLVAKIAGHIEKTGFMGFPIARQPEKVRKAAMKYITDFELTEDMHGVGIPGDDGFWSEATRTTLLLLRGILAGGVLGFALGQKRWRVNFGLDLRRTNLAVPYRAKDSPALRSEFSHPDVVIVLTCLSYYYGGLADNELFLAFSHLINADQAEIEYQLWVKDAPDLPPEFRQLMGINLKDTFQCKQKVFQHLRFGKAVVDYYLSHIVFPKEMKEFPYKLSASGWDIGQVKDHPTTGFSGTNDSRKTLPTAVDHIDLDSQKHTNALVLEYLLRDENSVELMPPREELAASVSDAELLVSNVVGLAPPTRVILDVGAQILELDNLGMAKVWLGKVGDEKTQAVIFFNELDELSVLDNKGNIEPLQTSPFAKQLDQCLVFLDEAHTRGTDLVLPSDYRAAVTLGANLTKDRLVQACMRMRKLGKGQSVVFCVPEEIQFKIRELTKKPEITVSDILTWSISETCIDLRRSMPLWALQGERFERHSQLWAQSKKAGTISMLPEHAEKFQDPEAQTIEKRYRPQSQSPRELEFLKDPRHTENWNMKRIVERCREFEALDFTSGTLQEEQERELSPEIEQERQVQRPADAEPAAHKLHPDVKAFVNTGRLKQKPLSPAFKPAFSALEHTTAASHVNMKEFPQDLLVTADYARTIQVTGKYEKGVNELDDYIRPVQWILTGSDDQQSRDDKKAKKTTVKHMVVISPFEAQELLPFIKKSLAGVSLHLYAPRPNTVFKPIDHLELYVVPERFPGERLEIPRKFVVQLNLFSGQLYMSSYDEYVAVCETLGLAWEATGGDGDDDGRVKVAADGFIIGGNPYNKSTFASSPVQFFKILMTKMRRNCDSIEKTHVGRILDGNLLTKKDFAGGDADVKE